MPPSERGGLRAAFTNFKPETEKEAEMRLLGRAAEEAPAVPEAREVAQTPKSYTVATSPSSRVGGLTPRPLLQREPVRQLSFRCPQSLAAELRRKASYNQLQQQETIIAGIKRVVAELSDPPPGWEG